MNKQTPVSLFLLFYTLFSSVHMKSLQPYVAEIVDIPSNNQTILSVNSIKQGTSYIIFQAHSLTKNVTLSLHPNITMVTSETGSNIGILVIVKGQTVEHVYLTSQNNYTVKVLVFVSFGKNELNPVPGGCNLEFNMENDPNFHITYNTAITDLKFQWASNSTHERSCEQSPALYQLSYHLYVYYIGDMDLSEEAYFDGLKKMMTVSDVKENGRKLQEVKYAKSKLPMSKLPSYTGQGTIYNLVVANGYRSAAYVPMTTYSCDLDSKNSHCEDIYTAGRVLITIVGVVGVFLCLVGHKFFQAGNSLMSLCGFFVVFYLVLNLSTDQSLIVIYVLSLVLATITAVLWLMVWWYFGQPVLSILVPGLTAGYLFSCILFYTPFGNIHYLSTRYNYGMSFTVGVLVLPVLILYWTKVLNILSCSFVGSFLITLTIDVWIKGGIRFILINTFRHAYIDNYLDVIVTGPFQTKDIILTCIWAVLFISGAVFQFYRAKGRPDFPNCPRKERNLRRRGENREITQNRQIGRSLNDDDEQAPLLTPEIGHNYATVESERSELT